MTSKQGELERQRSDKMETRRAREREVGEHISLKLKEQGRERGREVEDNT